MTRLSQDITNCLYSVFKKKEAIYIYIYVDVYIKKEAIYVCVDMLLMFRVCLFLERTYKRKSPSLISLMVPVDVKRHVYSSKEWKASRTTYSA